MPGAGGSLPPGVSAVQPEVIEANELKCEPYVTMKLSNFFLKQSAKTRAPALALGALLFAFGCGSGAATKELNNLQSQWPITGDAGSEDAGYTTPTTPTTPTYPTIPTPPTYPTTPGYDAGIQVGDGDAGTTVDTDGGIATPGSDAGSIPGLPNLFGDGGILNPGQPTTSTPDAGSPPAGDPHGPCAALNLVCFDVFDMWIHPECQTCNNGKGCQGCALTAY